jgi:CrcB protein
MNLALVALGGALGALARYALGGWIHRSLGSAFPIGTLTINVLGCFAIGGVLYLTVDRPALSAEARLFVAVGVLGGFTTFSTFGYETFEMLRDGSVVPALANVALSGLLGLLAVWLGHAAASAIWR